MAGIFGLLMSGAGVIKDQYYNLTSLLLPGNGTNGAQNNTFLDGSSNNFTITRNGNTTQGTFSPFSQTGWGNRFDGATSTRLTLASSSDFAFGTGAYTIEAWVYITAFSSSGNIIFDSGNASGSIALSMSNTGGVLINKGGTGAVLSTSSSVVSLNAWNHIAVSRVSTSTNETRIFVNGVLSVTGTDNNNWTVTTDPSIGGINFANYTINGWISNLSVLKGTAKYTAAFTPSVTPLPTNTANQVLLTCQANRFIDSNTATTAKTLTINGTPQITPFSPFAPTQSYSAAAVGGSGYFDVVDDFLTWGPGSSVQFGTGNFTIEVWIYITVTPAGQYIIDARNSSQTTAFALLFGGTGSGRLAFFDGSIFAVDEATSSIKANEWAHCCVVRSGSTISLFINGVRAGVNSSYSGNMSTAPTLSYIGKRYAAVLGEDFEFPGYMSSLRIVKGTAVYDPTQTNITIPTAPLTAITNTQLLLNFTNAGITDATAKNVLETVGNAQISTTQSKWGGGSIYLDGTANTALRLATGNILSPFSGDYTYECWVRLSSFAGVPVIFDTRASNGSVPGLQLSCTTGGVLQLYGGATTSTLLITGATLSTGQWYYIALVRSGSGSNNTKLYLDGSQTGSSATDTTNYNNQGGFIGAGASGTSNYVTGYIDDFRFTRYARTITASPSAPFPVQ